MFVAAIAVPLATIGLQRDLTTAIFENRVLETWPRWPHTRGRDKRCRGNTWFIPYETIQSRAKERPHPATFPVQLAEWCIKLHGGSRIDTMLDPFLGIGNSAVAAKTCGVKTFIGFEIDETYLAEAKRRIAVTSP